MKYLNDLRGVRPDESPSLWSALKQKLLEAAFSKEDYFNSEAFDLFFSRALRAKDHVTLANMPFYIFGKPFFDLKEPRKKGIFHAVLEYSGQSASVARQMAALILARPDLWHEADLERFFKLACALFGNEDLQTDGLGELLAKVLGRPPLLGRNDLLETLIRSRLGLVDSFQNPRTAFIDAMDELLSSWPHPVNDTLIRFLVEDNTLPERSILGREEVMVALVHTMFPRYKHLATELAPRIVHRIFNDRHLPMSKRPFESLVKMLARERDPAFVALITGLILNQPRVRETGKVRLAVLPEIEKLSFPIGCERAISGL